MSRHPRGPVRLPDLGKRFVSIGMLALLLAVAAWSCGGNDDDSIDDSIDEQPARLRDGEDPSTVERPVGAADDWWRPPVDVSWQWQLSGAIDTSYDVDVYDIDLFDAPESLIAALRADGRRVVCYFSAGSSENWREDFGQFAADVQGEALDGWEGERWLDIRADSVIDIMIRRLDLAARKGCDGVEPDNLQAYASDTGFDLTIDDQLAYNAALAFGAHDRGLAVGLKNAAELIPDLIGEFDFSVNEECHDFDECDPYRAFVAVGKPVLNAEYAERYANDPAVRDALCKVSAGEGFQTLVLPLDLDNTFRHSCNT